MSCKVDRLDLHSEEKLILKRCIWVISNPAGSDMDSSTGTAAHSLTAISGIWTPSQKGFVIHTGYTTAPPQQVCLKVIYLYSLWRPKGRHLLKDRARPSFHSGWHVFLHSGLVLVTLPLFAAPFVYVSCSSLDGECLRLCFCTDSRIVTPLTLWDLS